MKCGLCGKTYAVLPVTLTLSCSLRPRYCDACGTIIYNLIQKQKRDMRINQYADDHK